MIITPISRKRNPIAEFIRKQEAERLSSQCDTAEKSEAYKRSEDIARKVIDDIIARVVQEQRSPRKRPIFNMQLPKNEE